MIYTDYTEIKKISFKDPEFMSPDAEDKAIKLFNDIKELKDKIGSLRTEATLLDKDLKKLEERWNDILPLLDIEYGTKEKEEVKGEINLGFNFGTEVNKHLH